ncbi:DUF4143 domain-containing protein [Patescibacteria group bacterium]|nr:DUF4143 domain-containing protein [Patescibacteria group bacterium]MBU4512286.1 DUF4143 domain-containing protein [Patescibacteria group bacterium]MCG2693640.1 DUF4143 domain-containing protein [Candidatus Parcubacteria bacterium]
MFNRTILAKIAPFLEKDQIIMITGARQVGKTTLLLLLKRYLENIVFLKFLNRYKIDDINFWRTQNKNEVDFIVNREQAFEVKFNSKHFQKSKYLKFIQEYPSIKLQLISYDNIINKLKLGELT